MWRRTALLSAAIAASSLAGQEIGAGKLLVAKPELRDPNFAESVILIVQYDPDKGAAGLILNRRTGVPLAKVFPGLKGAKLDPVYEGGPVEIETAQALLRAKEKPEGAIRLFGDVYLSGSKDVIEKSVASGASPKLFHVYAGYGGWAAGQLEEEIEIGGWSVMTATAAIVFDDDPDSLWERLRRQSDRRIALAASLPGRIPAALHSY